MKQPESLELAELFDRGGTNNALHNAAAKELRRLHSLNQELVEAFSNVLAHLVAAHSLLQRGGKKAAPSDTIFMMMLKDCEKSIGEGRAVLAKSRGEA